MAVPPIVHAEHRVIRRLRHSGATSPDAAADVESSRLIDGRALARLVAARVILEPSVGRYWLDEDAYHRFRAARRMRALYVGGFALLVLIVLLVLGVLK